MTVFSHVLGAIREHCPGWVYTVLLVGWWVLTVLTLISLADLGYRLFRRDHGLKP